MTSRWHHSRLFWLGLPVLLLLLWMWLGYLDTMLHVGWTTLQQEYRLRWGGGEAAYSVFSDQSLRYGGASLFSDRGIGLKTFEEPADSFSTTNMAEATIALPQVISIYTLLWLGVLTLWQRRKHRLMTNPLDPA